MSASIALGNVYFFCMKFAEFRFTMHIWLPFWKRIRSQIS